jgi:hypothetical protein
MPKLVGSRRKPSPTIAERTNREIWFQGRFFGFYDERVEFEPLRRLKPHPAHGRSRTPRGFMSGHRTSIAALPLPAAYRGR